MSVFHNYIIPHFSGFDNPLRREKTDKIYLFCKKQWNIFPFPVFTSTLQEPSAESDETDKNQVFSGRKLDFSDKES
jgi:hypothetical protein